MKQCQESGANAPQTRGMLDAPELFMQDEKFKKLAIDPPFFRMLSAPFLVKKG